MSELGEQLDTDVQPTAVRLARRLLESVQASWPVPGARSRPPARLFLTAASYRASACRPWQVSTGHWDAKRGRLPAPPQHRDWLARPQFIVTEVKQGRLTPAALRAVNCTSQAPNAGGEIASARFTGFVYVFL
jgi:hypothetical protein